ncbi:MAG: hypothetical protein IPK08_18125 [Bacteroidetes bacterium]|nr:hypothetical protein [Bacteroidota bacterium]
METIYCNCFDDTIVFISGHPNKGLGIKNLKIIDSTTISLFTDGYIEGCWAQPWMAPAKGAAKVHAMMDAFSGVTEFVRMTAARIHDKQFLYKLIPSDDFCCI